MKGLAGPEHCANCLIDRGFDGLARRLRSSDHSRRTNGGTCASKHTGDRYGPQADCRDIEWLRKLRDARAANQPTPDIPPNVVRKLTLLACPEVKAPRG